MFLDGGGKLGALMRAGNWTSSPLGHPDTWPDALKTAVSIVLNSTTLGTVLWGDQLIMLYNDAYIPSLADRHPSALGRPVADVWGDAWDRVSEPFYSAMKTGRGFSQLDVELPMIRNGKAEVTYWNFTASPIRDARGEIVGLFNQGVEITGQVQANRLASEEQQKQRLVLRQRDALLRLSDTLQTVQEPSDIAYMASEMLGIELGVSRVGYGSVNSSTGVLTVDRDWNAPGIVSLAGTLNLHDFGAFVDEMKQGRTVSVADAYEDNRTKGAAAALVDRHAQAFVNAALVEKDEIVSLLFVNSAVARHWSESELTFIRETANLARSTMERRRAERALVEMNASLEREVAERVDEIDRMWNASPDLLLVIDFEGRFVRTNPAWHSLLGYSTAELVGHHVNDFIVSDDIEETRAAYETAAAGGLPKIANRYRHKDGSIRWFSWVAAPTRGLTYATGRDVTAEKAAEEELSATREALRQSQKMEAVGQLTGGLAHDFNNLLAGISGSLDLIETRMKQGRLSEIDRYVLAAKSASQRAAALTHRLLAFSRRQTLAPKPTDVNRLIADMRDLIQRSVGPAVAVEAVAAGGLWNTLVDQSQLENALLNLSLNARDAMPDGGLITIETANRWLDARAAKERELPPGQYISICVSDTGTGMTPEILERAYDPFYTTKPIGMGTGLGLSMVYGFAKQSDGQVRIYSEIGSGTMVCIYLPRQYENEALEPDGPLLTDVPRAENGQTVLVVDDEPLVRMLVTDTLEELGYAFVEAADGAAALKVLQSDTRLDLLITDVGLPGGMNGRQVAEAARSARSDLKVLFITGYAENAVLNHGHLAPGMQVLTKPFAMDVLATRIKTLLTEP